MRLNTFLSWAQVVFRLGLCNVGRVASYRLGVALGIHRVRRLKATVPQAPFYRSSALQAVPVAAVYDWQISAKIFSFWPIQVGKQPPDWLANPLTGKRIAAPERSWWEIPDFDPAVGDIKLIWELSRMDWVLAMAQRARNGDNELLSRLNAWLADWCSNNPPFRGPNWKCGQEASIRVMHLAMASLILGQARHSVPGLLDLVRVHLQRIAPTVPYAMAQDNNHGTSEAAALFMGGSWLAVHGDTEGMRWQQAGRHLLEDRVARLIGAQGSFSQYSLNYHRVMVDTLCMVEVWRKHLELPAFSSHWQEKTRAAAQWLRSMVNHENGDGPNVGANDGARLLPLTDTEFRDHRPSAQLAMVLFAGERAYAQDGPWNYPLLWLAVPLPQALAQAPANRILDDGGFALLRRGPAMVLLRYPRFRFRPSHADALHVDLWLGGRNLLRDGGTFSYNADPRLQGYFPGTASHNTVQFDDRDQMPRLGRFLFGRWLKTSAVEPLHEQTGEVSFAAGYHDDCAATHHRKASLSANSLLVVDQIRGFRDKAILRWRLEPGPWQLEGNQLSNGDHVLLVTTDIPDVRLQLVSGWESRHYLERTPLPVLEIEVRHAGSITSEYRWHA